MNLYETLGVDKNADPSTIKKAYRTKAKSNHPDVGGDPDKFNNINQAYKVLVDPDRRNRYDRTGETDDNPFEKGFQEYILNTFIPLFEERIDVEKTDIVDFIKTSTSELINKHLSDKEDITHKLDVLHKAMQLTTFKGKGVDLFKISFEVRIKALNIEKENNTYQIQFLEEALDKMEEYEYKPSKEPGIEQILGGNRQWMSF